MLRIVDAADGGSSVCEHGRAAVDSESITPPGGATDSIRCGIEMAAAAKFCSECGTPVAQATPSAEYKQVTILFADVVHSMDIAAALGAERLREIMGELVRRSAAVVQRYNGTIDKFTGDGIMAVFGAPIALEDHAIRACLAALESRRNPNAWRTGSNAVTVSHCNCESASNSGQVVAGEIGCGGLGYTTIGEQVGMAQRMESVAPPGGVMLSESTARLVESAAELREPELVQIKGSDTPVAARRLLGVSEHASRGAIVRRRRRHPPAHRRGPLPDPPSRLRDRGGGAS